ncbi:MAG: queuosine precursor transporter [Emticicia sp.]|uniref:queuosine precursor transporter n=1 Tax=Emticicia sp. TaxID=1930953 RepID=UPI003BA3F8D4
MSDSIKTKKQTLYLILCGIFLTNAVVAEVIGAKIFSVEATLGIAPLQIPLFGQKFNFNMSAGVLNWPFVFITSDIINEYFGKSGVKKISYLTAILIAYAFIIIYISTIVSPADFWVNHNNKDNAGNFLNIDDAYGIIFRQGLGIILGSITAFLVGQILDATVFHWLRKYTNNKMIWLRATGSTLVSQLIDSFVVIFIAFYVFGNWTITEVVTTGTNNYIYKFVVAILLTPLIYLAHSIIDKYLGKEHAHQIIDEATFTPM